MVVYANAGDALPSRIYFYDSNAPGVDELYMELSSDGEEFTYDMADDLFTGDYHYGTDDGYILTAATVDHILSDTGLLLSVDLDINM